MEKAFEIGDKVVTVAHVGNAVRTQAPLFMKVETIEVIQEEAGGWRYGTEKTRLTTAKAYVKVGEVKQLAIDHAVEILQTAVARADYKE